MCHLHDPAMSEIPVAKPMSWTISALPSSDVGVAGARLAGQATTRSVSNSIISSRSSGVVRG